MSKASRIRPRTPAEVDYSGECWIEDRAGHRDVEDRVVLHRAIERTMQDLQLCVHEAYDAIGRPQARRGDATPTDDLRTILDAVRALPPFGSRRAA